MGTSQVQGELWGAKAEDWARLQEPRWSPVFERALSIAGVGAQMRLLDVGCGAGGALMIARRLGAEVSGLDGSESLVAIARARLPGARVEVGDMEELPFDDESFDVVTGVNSFQFADSLARTFAEARRVCQPGGRVFALAWGRREDCQLMTVTMPAVLALQPRSGASAPAPSADQSAVEHAMRGAGLEPVDRGEFSSDLNFPDATTAVAAIMSAGATVKISRAVGEAPVRDAILGTLRSVSRPDGSVVWTNRFRWVMARRPSR